MLKKKRNLIILLVSVLALIAIVAGCFLLGGNKTPNVDNGNNGNSTNIEEFTPSLNVSDTDGIKNTAKEEVKVNDDTTAYYVDGKYENMEGEYTYHIDSNNQITYSAFTTTPAEFNVRLTYNEMTEEEKEQVISDGYKKVEEQLNYITNTLKYKTRFVYKVMVDGSFEELETIPTTETLRKEFVNSETISCYLIDFETPDNKRISMSITSQGWYSISFVLIENK